MSTQSQKQAAAAAAIDHLVDRAVVGVGSGSTVNLFIAELGKVKYKYRIAGAVAASTASERLLREQNIDVLDLNMVDEIPVYVDGADEIDGRFAMIKGGGGALTREKIIAAVAKKFVCVADASKRVDALGRFPLPVEVIPMARSYVARRIVALGGTPELRTGLTTDNGNLILDVRGLDLSDPARTEAALDLIPGVVCNGLFALRPADVLLQGTDAGVQSFSRS
jgi:ribose 5-phosphate isomerase A